MKKLSNYTEAEIIQIVENISLKLAKKFKFAFYEADDIKQEMFVEAIKGLEKYEEGRPLENFLYVHLKNRLLNLKRNKFERPGKPCLKCKFYKPNSKKYTSECSLFDDKDECELFVGWLKRNTAKKNIISPIDIGGINDENERNTRLENKIDEELDNTYILNMIDKELPVILREDYIKLRDGIKITKARRDKIQEVILNILERNNLKI